MTWNANSIRSKVKQMEVEYLLSKHRPLLMLLSETKLNDNDFVQFPRYRTYRNDRQSDGGGGTAILIRENVKHEVVNTPSLKSSEATCVKLPLSNSKYLVVNSFYCPKNLLRDDLQKLMNLHSNVFMGGDYNAKHCHWHNSDNNNNGNVLHRFLIDDNTAELIHPNAHTCYRSKTNPSTIDLALAKGVKVASGSVSEFNPDHCPVEYLLQVDDGHSYEAPVRHFMYKESNWVKFRSIIDNELSLGRLNDADDVDSCVEHLSKVITSAMEESIPKKTFTGKGDLSPHLKGYIAEKKRLRRAYFRSKLKDDKLKMEINRLDLIIRNSINARDSRVFMNKLKQIRPNSKMFRNINKLLGDCRKTVPELKSNDGSLISNPLDKANAIAKVYDEIHKQNGEMGNVEFDNIVMSEIDSFCQMTGTATNTSTLHSTDADEIRRVIKGIKSKKSVGPDAIPSFILKKLPSSAHEFLAKLINCILSIGYYPSSWKAAHVIPIPKPGKPANEAKNFRPISLLNGLSKILEKVLHARILRYCDENNLIPNNQFGFKSRHSTVHALIRLLEESTMGFNDGKVTIAAFLDIEKAFDTMWIDGLIYKMLKFNFPHYLIRIVSSYLRDRIFRVRLGNQLSDPITVNDGVPQGSVLGPLLFIIFLADLPTHLNTTLTVFADDTSIFSTRSSQSRAKSNVQSHLYRLQRYYQMWKIRVNVEKSEALFIQKSNRLNAINENFYSLEMNGSKIPYKKSIRFLGYYVQPNLKHNEHVNRILLKVYTGLHKLYPVMNANNGISQDVKVKIYLTILRPVLTYGVAVWHTLPKYLIKRLKLFENKCLRMAMNFRRSRTNYKFISTDELHKYTRVPRLNVYLEGIARKALNGTYLHENPVISKFGNFSNQQIANCVYKPPHSLLRGLHSKLLSL